MSYTVLARRHRSATFNELVGQEAVATTLTNAIESGRIAHAFLFTGVRGVGKTSAARILAKCLNCLSADEPTAKPCLKCSSCQATNLGEDIDVIEIDGASNNSVDDVRELRRNAAYRPNRSRFKVYIIDEVHMLSKHAFNALLKILEEPPAHVKFIFATTEPQKIPPTILSRCQRYDFRTIPESEITAHLQKILKAEKVQAEAEAVAHIGRLAAGSMRDALSILDQLLSLGQKKLTSKQIQQVLGTPNFNKVLEMTEAIIVADLGAALAGLDELIRLGHSLEQIVAAAIDHCRDLMLLLACGSDTALVVVSGKNRKALIEQSSLLDVPTVVFFIGVLEQLSRAVRFSSSARALVEAGVVRLTARENFVSTEAMIAMLESGKSGSNSPASRTRRANHSSAAGPGPSSPARESKSRSANSVQADKPVTLRLAADEPLSLDRLKEIWPDFLKDLNANGNANLAALLKWAQPSDLTDNIVTATFQDQHRHLCNLANDQNRKVAIQHRLEQKLGRRIQLKLLAEDSRTDAQAPLARPRGAGLDRQTLKATKENPLISKTLEVFGGTILDVRENLPQQS